MYFLAGVGEDDGEGEGACVGPVMNKAAATTITTTIAMIAKVATLERDFLNKTFHRPNSVQK